MTDCIHFQTIIKELNPNDSNTGDCCSWSMVKCDGTSIVKIDFSDYKGIDKDVSFPQTVQFLSNLKEFSIKGQQHIKEIPSLPVENIEKIDLSNSGLSSSMFPTWIMDAQKIKELDISNTQITGMPQREIRSNIKSCSFSNTPICGTYQSSPYANFIPDTCKSSCSGGYTGSISSNGNNSTNNNGGTKVWPYILIGFAVVAILGALGFLYMKKSKRSDKLSNYDSPRPILPVSKKENKMLKLSLLKFLLMKILQLYQRFQHLLLLIVLQMKVKLKKWLVTNIMLPTEEMLIKIFSKIIVPVEFLLRIFIVNTIFRLYLNKINHSIHIHLFIIL